MHGELGGLGEDSLVDTYVKCLFSIFSLSLGARCFKQNVLPHAGGCRELLRDPILFTLQPYPNTGLMRRQEVLRGWWSTKAVAGRLGGDVPGSTRMWCFSFSHFIWAKGKVYGLRVGRIVNSRQLFPTVPGEKSCLRASPTLDNSI